ncbi:unnamed protein product [Urochloa decumbens]|uniref:Uncharacterized protein n=1 Tax=Urochloa decumbens TaxID=240449 RepID=A0ABC9F2Y0_9POAL
MANIRTVSSLADVNNALQEMNINAIDQAGQVQFRLHEQTSLQEAAKIKMNTQPGKHGFNVVNPELLDCKYRVKVALEESYNTMFDACMRQCDDELLPVEASIAELKALELSTDQQIPHIGPDVFHRNRGVQQMLYPNPPFDIYPGYEYGTAHQRVPYQPAYTTQSEIDDAIARDKRAQRAVWAAKLRFMEARKDVLEKKKIEMERRMRAEYERVMEDPSDLGVGYTEYHFLPLV